MMSRLMKYLILLTLFSGLNVISAQVNQQTSYFYYLDTGKVFRYDPDRQTSEVVFTGAEADIDHATISADGRYLAYVEMTGTLRWIDLDTQVVTAFPPRPTPTIDWPEGQIYHSYVAPVSWSSDGKLLLSQALWESPHPGWTSVDEPVWHDFPPRPQAPDAFVQDETYYGCGWTDWSPDGSQLLFASGGPGTACVFLSGLTLIDLENHSAHRIVAEQILDSFQGISLMAGVQHPAWSPDNQWIAFTMQVGTLSRDYRNQFPYSLYIAHPDGTDRHLVVQDSEKAYMGCNQWSSGGNLAYVLIPIPPTITNPITRAGDLFIYQPTAETPTLALKDIPCPFNLSPDGRFITFVRDNRLMILSFETQAATTLSEQTVSENNIVGWTLE